MYQLIPIEDRDKYQCCVCGETRSVKYLIPTLDKELPYCNRCALLHSQLAERTTQQND